MMSGLEVAMAHVAGPALTQEGADEKQTMSEDTGNMQKGRTEGETGSHSTHKSRNEDEDDSQNEGWFIPSAIRLLNVENVRLIIKKFWFLHPVLCPKGKG